MPFVDPGPPPRRFHQLLFSAVGAALVIVGLTMLPAPVVTFALHLGLLVAVIAAGSFLQGVAEKLADGWNLTDGQRCLMGLVGFCVPIALLCSL